MNHRLAPLALLLVSASCSMSQDFGMDGGSVFPDRDLGATPPEGVVVCGGTTCASGQLCCFTTLTCIDAASACSVPAGAPAGACASNADCAATQMCDAVIDGALRGRCGGPGTCADRLVPGNCGTEGPVCGCDGRTYPTKCEASAQGVRIVGSGACGTRAWPDPGSTPSCSDGAACPTGWSCNDATHLCEADHPLITCGTDDQCPTASRCCGLTGVCIDATRPELCALPPDGTFTPCTTDDDCAPFNEEKLHFFHYYCDGPGCSGFGGCRRQRSTSDCGGELASVCGCNGAAYANSCWAQAAGTRIAHDGMCP